MRTERLYVWLTNGNFIFSVDPYQREVHHPTGVAWKGNGRLLGYYVDGLCHSVHSKSFVDYGEVSWEIQGTPLLTAPDMLSDE